MTIDEAVASLKSHLADDEVFHVRHDGKQILVDVLFIYRLKEVMDDGNFWNGFPLICGVGKTRISNW